VRASLTAEVLQAGATAETSDELIRGWLAHDPQAVGRCVAVLRDVAADDRADLATLSVALREVRGLVSSASGVAEH
jgi:glutamate dehydrogenase